MSPNPWTLYNRWPNPGFCPARLVGTGGGGWGPGGGGWAVRGGEVLLTPAPPSPQDLRACEIHTITLCYLDLGVNKNKQLVSSLISGRRPCPADTIHKKVGSSWPPIWKPVTFKAPTPAFCCLLFPLHDTSFPFFFSFHKRLFFHLL